MIITIISILVTIVCLAVILSIIGKYWQALNSIDLESLPSERDARTKKKIVSERLRRQYHHVRARVGTTAEPLTALVRERTRRMRDAFSDTLDSLRRQKRGTHEHEHDDELPRTARIDRALAAAEQLSAAAEFEEAEKRYIDIIAQDAKNLKSYEGLSRIYVRQKEWASAQEVLEFLCTNARERVKNTIDDPAQQSMLEMQLAEWLEELSGVYLMREQRDSAERTMREAVEIQPQNPKFLDASLEMYIMLGKRREARAALSCLRDTNPENQKLSEFEARINNL